MPALFVVAAMGAIAGILWLSAMGTPQKPVERSAIERVQAP